MKRFVKRATVLTQRRGETERSRLLQRTPLSPSALSVSLRLCVKVVGPSEPAHDETLAFA